MNYAEFLRDTKDCPFCYGDYGVSRVIRENATSYMTYSLWPYHKHHLLVIPKRHVESLTELTSEEKADIASLNDMALAVMKKLRYVGVSQLVREGNVINKAVRHVHFHTIPNVPIGDIRVPAEERKMLSDTEIAELISEVRANM